MVRKILIISISLSLVISIIAFQNCSSYKTMESVGLSCTNPGGDIGDEYLSGLSDCVRSKDYDELCDKDPSAQLYKVKATILYECKDNGWSFVSEEENSGECPLDAPCLSNKACARPDGDIGDQYWSDWGQCERAPDYVNQCTNDPDTTPWKVSSRIQHECQSTGWVNVGIESGTNSCPLDGPCSIAPVPKACTSPEGDIGDQYWSDWGQCERAPDYDDQCANDPNTTPSKVSSRIQYECQSTGWVNIGGDSNHQCSLDDPCPAQIVEVSTNRTCTCNTPSPWVTPDTDFTVQPTSCGGGSSCSGKFYLYNNWLYNHPDIWYNNPYVWQEGNAKCWCVKGTSHEERRTSDNAISHRMLQGYLYLTLTCPLGYKVVGSHRTSNYCSAVVQSTLSLDDSSIDTISSGDIPPSKSVSLPGCSITCELL